LTLVIVFLDSQQPAFIHEDLSRKKHKAEHVEEIISARGRRGPSSTVRLVFSLWKALLAHVSDVRENRSSSSLFPSRHRPKLQV